MAFLPLVEDMSTPPCQHTDGEARPRHPSDLGGIGRLHHHPKRFVDPRSPLQAGIVRRWPRSRRSRRPGLKHPCPATGARRFSAPTSISPALVRERSSRRASCGCKASAAIVCRDGLAAIRPAAQWRPNLRMAVTSIAQPHRTGCSPDRRPWYGASAEGGSGGELSMRSISDARQCDGHPAQSSKPSRKISSPVPCSLSS